MPENNNDFKGTVREWRGYTVRALEDIDNELKDIKNNNREDFERINRKIDKMNNRITNMQMKVAAIGGTVGIISALITTVLINGLG